ncbi:hypothetical protein HHK36_028809 [Tetracentron sinense]|uniref:Uncharacterized protein n=1 Tax=Tetracentron sinense TaxID=13715 RepID=A0A835D0Y5_TETSI|nr:hypothetical protein HHK36_028809 [Tetracentron sinense]
MGGLGRSGVEKSRGVVRVKPSWVITICVDERVLDPPLPALDFPDWTRNSCDDLYWLVIHNIASSFSVLGLEDAFWSNGYSSNFDSDWREKADWSLEKQSTFFSQLAAKMVPNGIHCLSMRLTIDYYLPPPKKRKFLKSEDLENPDLYNYTLSLTMSWLHHCQLNHHECQGEVYPKLDKRSCFLMMTLLSRKTGPDCGVDLHGKVNAAVETCGESFHRFDKYLNFSNPYIAWNFDPNCMWVGLWEEPFDLKEWKKDITGIITGGKTNMVSKLKFTGRGESIESSHKAPSGIIKLL